MTVDKEVEVSPQESSRPRSLLRKLAYWFLNVLGVVLMMTGLVLGKQCPWESLGFNGVLRTFFTTPEGIISVILGMLAFGTAGYLGQKKA